MEDKGAAASRVCELLEAYEELEEENNNEEGNENENGDVEDPPGTKVKVHDVVGGQVLVKKTFPPTNESDGKEIVQKTLYADRKIAASHGYVAGM